MCDSVMASIGESGRYAVKPAAKRTKCINPGVYMSAAHHRYLNEIEKHCHRLPFMLKMHHNRHIGLVVGRHPCISCEVQFSVVFLTHVGKYFRILSHSNGNLLVTYQKYIYKHQ